MMRTSCFVCGQRLHNVVCSAWAEWSWLALMQPVSGGRVDIQHIRDYRISDRLSRGVCRGQQSRHCAALNMIVKRRVMDVLYDSVLCFEACCFTFADG